MKTQADDAYTSHNTKRLNVDEMIKKLRATEYIQEELNKMENG